MGSKLRWLQTTTIRHLIMHLLCLAVFQEDQNKVQLVVLMRIQMSKTLQESVLAARFGKFPVLLSRNEHNYSRIFYNLVVF